MRKESLKRRINKLNAVDPMADNVMEAIAVEMDTSDIEDEQIILDMFFDSCSMKQLEFFEKNEYYTTPVPEQRGQRSRSSGKMEV